MMRLAVALALMSFALAACGSDNNNGNDNSGGGATSAKPAPAKPAQKTQKHDPVSCLKGANLSNVTERPARFWTGHMRDGLSIRVVQFGSEGDARGQVETASAVVAKQAGVYGVFGPVKSRDDGSTAAVAACLSG
jgi:hypothetical protein